MQKKKGFTIIHISNLEKYEDKDLSFTPDFVRRIGRYYGQVIDNIPGEVEVTFQEGTEEPIVMECEDLFSDSLIKKKFGYFPGFEPRSFYSKFKGMKGPDGTRKDVKVTVKFGITRDNQDGTKGVSGVYVYGNDRFFFGPEEDASGAKFGFGTESDYGGKIKQLNHITYGFRAKVDIVAEWPRDIPWNIGKKNGYDTTNPTHTHIAKMLQFAAYYYLTFISKPDKHHRSPFTYTGVDLMNGDDWKKCFFPDNWEMESFSSDSKCNASRKLLEDWVPRTNLLDSPVDISKLGSFSAVSGSWIPKDMEDIKDIVAKKQENVEYDDHDWIKHLCEVYKVKLDSKDEKKISDIERSIEQENTGLSKDRHKLEDLILKNQDMEAELKKVKSKITSGPKPNKQVEYNKLLSKQVFLSDELESGVEEKEKLIEKISVAEESKSNQIKKILEIKSKAKSQEVSVESKKSFKLVKSKKAIKNNQKVQGYVPYFIIKELEEETSLLKHDSHLTRYLLAHYLLTKDQFKESKMPVFTSQQKGAKELAEWWKKKKK